MKLKKQRHPGKVIKAVCLDVDLAAWIESAAKAENRSVSNFAETLLAKHMEERKAAKRPAFA